MGIFSPPERCRLCGDNAAMARECYCALCKMALQRVKAQVQRKERSDWERESHVGYTVAPRAHDLMMAHECTPGRQTFNAASCTMCGRSLLKASSPFPRWEREFRRHFALGALIAEDNAIKTGQRWFLDEEDMGR